MAGAMMAIFIFMGLFIARARNAAVGWSIVAAAAIFLGLSQAKAATGLFPVVMLLSWAVHRLRSRVLCALLIFGVLIGLSLMTVGSLYFDAIKAFNKAMLSDPTFTGRTDIWQFAIDNIKDRLWLGHGFGAFWETPVTFFQPATEGSQVTFASHAHNAFLDLALTVGLPGVVLAAIWALALPFLDWQRCRRTGADPDLTLLFLRIWLFVVLNCSFESLLFARGEPNWFNMLVAMFGLRYLSVARVTR
jgi:O-antigen ligase